MFDAWLIQNGPELDKEIGNLLAESTHYIPVGTHLEEIMDEIRTFLMETLTANCKGVFEIVISSATRNDPIRGWKNHRIIAFISSPISKLNSGNLMVAGRFEFVPTPQLDAILNQSCN